jgi:lipopolysaccharide exporter
MQVNIFRWNDAGSLSAYRALMCEYREFPFYSVPTGLLRGFIQKMPVIVLGIVFTPAIVGLYAMANRIARVPIDIVSSSLRRIYMQRVAKLLNNGDAITGVLIKTTVGLFIVGVVPFALLAGFGEVMFERLLGESWREAGLYASVLVPWLFSTFIVSPSTTNFVVLKRQPMLFNIQVYTGVLGIGTFIVAYSLSAGPFVTLAAFSVVATFANIFLFTVSLMITRAADRQVMN